MSRSILFAAVLSLIAAASGCSAVSSFVDDFFSGDSQRQAIGQATGNSPNERIQAQGADATRKLNASHPDAPRFTF
jgi:hypothetical protein